MHRPGAGGRITRRRRFVIVLRAGLGHNFNARSNAIPIAPGPLQFDLEPMIRFGAVIHPNFGWSFQRGNDNVHFPIAIQVSYGGATVPRGRLRGEAGFGCQGRKLHATKIMEKAIPQTKAVKAKKEEAAPAAPEAK